MTKQKTVKDAGLNGVLALWDSEQFYANLRSQNSYTISNICSDNASLFNYLSSSICFLRLNWEYVVCRRIHAVNVDCNPTPLRSH